MHRMSWIRTVVGLTGVILLSSAAIARTDAVSRDENNRVLNENDKVSMYASDLKRIDMTAIIDGESVTNTGGVGLIASSGDTPAVAAFVTSVGGTGLPQGVKEPFPGGIVVSNGVAMMRGWRPMIRTVRTTTVAPGSCIAVEVDNSRKVERICLLSSDGVEGERYAWVWLNDKPDAAVRIEVGQFVEVSPIAGSPRDWDFRRNAQGSPIISEIEDSSAVRKRFVALIERLDCGTVTLN